MMTNNGAALLAGVRSGLGLGMVASFEVCGHMAAGRIEPVLPDWRLPEYRVYACYPIGAFFRRM